MGRQAARDCGVRRASELGGHRLLAGDARDKRSYDQLLGDEVADMIFLDPPYNVRIGGRGALNRPDEESKSSWRRECDWDPKASEFVAIILLGRARLGSNCHTEKHSRIGISGSRHCARAGSATPIRTSGIAAVQPGPAAGADSQTAHTVIFNTSLRRLRTYDLSTEHPPACRRTNGADDDKGFDHPRSGRCDRCRRDATLRCDCRSVCRDPHPRCAS
jgi:hypothetical protein